MNAPRAIGRLGSVYRNSTSTRCSASYGFAKMICRLRRRSESIGRITVWPRTSLWTTITFPTRFTCGKHEDWLDATSSRSMMPSFPATVFARRSTPTASRSRIGRWTRPHASAVALRGQIRMGSFFWLKRPVQRRSRTVRCSLRAWITCLSGRPFRFPCGLGPHSARTGLDATRRSRRFSSRVGKKSGHDRRGDRS